MMCLPMTKRSRAGDVSGNPPSMTCWKEVMSKRLDIDDEHMMYKTKRKNKLLEIYSGRQADVWSFAFAMNDLF